MPLTLCAPPFLFLLVVPCILVLLHGWRASVPLRRTHSASILRGATLCLLIVALAQPVWPSGGGASATVVVADASASISVPGRAREIAWLDAIVAELPRGAARGLVVFAGGARLTSLSALANGASPPGPASADAADQTDIERALRLALGALPQGGRIVLLSEGLQTEGNALSAAGTARARGVVVDTVPLPESDRPDAALTRLQAPSALHPGDAMPLLVTVRSTVARRAIVTIAQDGRPVIRSALPLRVGDNPLLASLRAPGPGWHTYRAAVSMPGDTLRENDTLETTVRVARRAKVLIVGPAASSRRLASLLGGFGIDARVARPASVPDTVPSIARYDGVTLDDVPAGELTPRQVAALDDAVRIRGVGLLVLGGPHSLTLGGYYRAPLESILPVMSAPPGLARKGAIGLQLVLDRSGSMDDLAGDVPKIQMAQAAADVAVTFATQHRDDLGIVSFDEAPHILVPLQRVTAAGAPGIHRIVRGLTAQGGTNIYAALQAGLRQLLRSRAPFKHILLMTDGVSEPAHYGPLLALARRNQVTISTIGLGQDADVGLLRYLARWGKGRFYYTENARDLPRIFAREARLSAGPSRRVGSISVTLGAASPVTGSVSRRLPPVHGVVVTTPKPEALSPLIAPARGRNPDPLLAVWQDGLGRVAVWTPGFSPSWAGAWMTREPGLWRDVSHWMLRGPATPLLLPRLQPDGASVAVDTLQNAGVFLDLARLQGTLVTPRGRHRRLAFQQEGPARYVAALPDTEPGVYRLRVAQMTAPYGQAEADLSLPYPQEYLLRAGNVALLADLADLTGGRLLREPRDLGATSSVGPLGQELWWPLAALALLLFLGSIAQGLKWAGGQGYHWSALRRR
ncbi:MAG: VWA domain-containing protein [Chloroflexi bacterium]|nr:VWA domain-containing protein [Chloroflexota bacterium]